MAINFKIPKNRLKGRYKFRFANNNNSMSKVKLQFATILVKPIGTEFEVDHPLSKDAFTSAYEKEKSNYPDLVFSNPRFYESTTHTEVRFKNLEAGKKYYIPVLENKDSSESNEEEKEGSIFS